MTIQQVTLPECTVSLVVGGIFHVRWIRGASITEQHALEALAAVTQLGGHDNILMMVDITGVAVLERAARAVFAHERCSRKVAVIGSSPVDEVIAHYFTALDRRVAHTRYFTSTAEAEAWLRS